MAGTFEGRWGMKNKMNWEKQVYVGLKYLQIKKKIHVK